MTGSPRSAADGAANRFARAAARAVHSLTAALERRWVLSVLGGLALLALLAWYVTWHVPTSSWVFTSHYAIGFKDLVYRIYDIRRVQQGGTLYSARDHLQYFVYPPAAAWLFWPLTWSTVFVGELWWTFASMVSLAAMIASAGRFACGWPWRRAWAVSLLVGAPASILVLQPVGVHLALGQVGLFLAAAATFDLLCVRGRARGVLVGVTAALKIYPIVYFAIFVLRREWRALGNAFAGLFATTALAWLAFPSDSTTFFLHRLLSGRELRHYWHNAHWISSSSSLYTVFFRQPFTGAPLERTAGFALCVAVLCFGVAAAWRQTVEGREVGAFLCVALASTIGSPVSWDHYFIWVVLIPFVVVERGALPWFRTASLGLFGLTCLVPLRLARNEDLSHKAYDAVFAVIFMARNALTVVSLLWLLAAVLPDRSAQRSASITEAHQPASAS